MEEEQEEEECEIQDEEYDGFQSDIEDMALYRQFVEPLFDVSDLPKMPNKVPENWIAVSGNGALTQGLISQSNLQPSLSVANVGLNNSIQDNKSLFDISDLYEEAQLEVWRKKTEEAIEEITAQLKRSEAQREEMAAQLKQSEAEKEEMATEIQELRAKHEVMAKKIKD